MRVGIALGVGLVCLACVGVVAANQPPLASAGLDQDARANTTVYLDAGGSIDPDGSIATYEWTIVRPDGNTTTPNCETCAKTWFVPRETGRYNVTATVTDEDGASQRDTLYVAVSAPLRLPSSPSSSGSGGGSFAGASLSGGNPGNGNWNAVVYDGSQLTISTTRGTDFVLGTPDGQVRISQSRLDMARADDGKITFDEVNLPFQRAGLSRRDVRLATERTMENGNTCAASQGSCTTAIRDDVLTVGGNPVGDPESARGTYNPGIRSGETRSDSSQATFDQTIHATVTSYLDNDSNDSSSGDTTGGSFSSSVVGEVADAVSTVFDGGDDDSVNSDKGAEDNEDDTIDVSGAVP